MILSVSFFKALMPVVVATTQALAAPGVSSEPPSLALSPATVQLERSAHTTPNAQASFADWKKRLYEARAGVLIATVQQTQLSQPVPTAGL